jgi:integrase
VTQPRKPKNRRKLTAALVAGLQPAAQPYSVWDAYQRGLVLTVRPTGRKGWFCVYRFHGRPRWYTIGDAAVVSLVLARKHANKVLLAVIDGKDPGAERRVARSAGTFADLAARYLDEHAKLRNKSWQQAAALVRRNLLPRWGALPAASITRADVKAMMGRCASHTVANQTLAAASAIFTWAVKEEVGNIRINPCNHVARNATQSRERVLAPAELAAIWPAFDNAGLVVGTALKLVLLTGQRPGEVCAMHTEHITDGWWSLPGQPVKALGWPGTKNGVSHRVWLPHAAQELLEELGSTGRVFACRRGALSKAMGVICRKLDLPKATPHDLRRTHGTTITALGFGRDAMNRIQNHKEGGIATVYDRHQYADENKRIMEAVTARLLGRCSVVVRANFGLSGVKRTFGSADAVSANDPKRSKLSTSRNAAVSCRG